MIDRRHFRFKTISSFQNMSFRINKIEKYAFIGRIIAASSALTFATGTSRKDTIDGRWRVIRINLIFLRACGQEYSSRTMQARPAARHSNGSPMADDITDLDGRRGMAAQQATELRRLRIEVESDQAALRSRQEELEKFLVAAPAGSWPEAVEKARYLLSLFAQTPAAEDPRRQYLIRSMYDDFDRLLARKEHDNDDVTS
jgi:hypothetical protein